MYVAMKKSRPLVADTTPDKVIDKVIEGEEFSAVYYRKFYSCKCTTDRIVFHPKEDAPIRTILEGDIVIDIVECE
jgi:hypothetical protein